MVGDTDLHPQRMAQRVQPARGQEYEVGLDISTGGWKNIPRELPRITCETSISECFTRKYRYINDF